jgi:very-short-patch-repair endonuclease
MVIGASRKAPLPVGEGGWGEGSGTAKRARDLRRNATDAERLLWQRLRKRGLAGLKFRRQVPVDRYVVDFLCESAGIIVEVDGGQHADTNSSDAHRDAVLADYGYLVLRFWNNDVHSNIEGALATILESIPQRISHEAS